MFDIASEIINNSWGEGGGGEFKAKVRQML